MNIHRASRSELKRLDWLAKRRNNSQQKKREQPNAASANAKPKPANQPFRCGSSVHWNEKLDKQAPTLTAKSNHNSYTPA